MSFNKNDAANLLAKCHRRCCICHRWCGVKMELHHVEHKSKGGSDSIDNAVPLCFECHAEVNHYNDDHPKGRKFTVEELLLHKSQWLDICKSYPDALISAPRNVDIGPLEGMLLELQHNITIVQRITNGTAWQDKIGCVLFDDEYKRSLGEGSILLLPDDLRNEITIAYAHVGRINTFVNMYSSTPPEGNAFSEATNRLLEAYRKSDYDLNAGFIGLGHFLQKDEEVKTNV